MITSLLWITFAMVAADESDRPCLVLITGAPGTEEYSEQFQQWAQRWEGAAKQAGMEVKRIGASKTATDDRQQLQATLKQVSQKTAAPLWVVLIVYAVSATLARLGYVIDGAQAQEAMETGQNFVAFIIVFFVGDSAPAPHLSRWPARRRLSPTSCACTQAIATSATRSSSTMCSTS